MKTPAFWYKKNLTLPAAFLIPFSWLYMAGATLRKLVHRKPHRSAIPVICIGNLTAGGSGKTPVTIAIMRLLADERLSQKPCFLSRGYGGCKKGPLFVDRHKDSCRDVGDEPLLLARHGTTIISRNRAAGAVMAEKHGADMIVMDDGLQNLSLEKDICFTVIDGASGFGNALLIPAGPLREKVVTGFKKSDAFIVVGDDTTDIQKTLPSGKPVIRARLSVPEDWITAKDVSYVAFCGLGRPEKFRRTIEALGLKIAGWHEFPDHHAFQERELKHLDNEALGKNARLLTTEKDAVRIPSGFKFEGPLDIMPVRIEWIGEDNKKLAKIIADRTKGRRHG